MTKVAFLTGEYPPMQGGIADHIAYLTSQLASLQIESSVLITRRWQEIMVENSPPPPDVYPVLSGWSWRCWAEIARFLDRQQPDILHIQYQAAAFELTGWVNWLPYYLRKRRIRTRIVTTFHDLRTPYIFPKAGVLRWQSMLMLARYSHAVICTNREDLHTLQQKIDNPLLVRIPLGSNADPQPPPDFVRGEWRKKYQVTNDTLLLAYFGFLNESKGAEELIEAVAILRQQGVDARLLFIGGDIGHADPTNMIYAKQSQAMIDRLGLSDFVYRTGYVELSVLSANLLAVDVVVMPYRDGVSFRRTTLIAALRHGRPVVSTTPPVGVPSIPEIKPGENMLLSSPHNATDLAKTIALLAYDTKLREKLAIGAKLLGNLFEWDNIAEKTRELYRKI